jgi:hypothetical protein
MKQWMDYQDLIFLGESNHGLYFRARPPAHATPRSDLFSVGATLHLILTGQSVFAGIPRHDMLAALRYISTTAPTLSDNPRFPALLALAGDCLASNPDDRPERAAAVADRIEAVLEEECRAEADA